MLLVGACAKGTADLEQWVAEVKSRRGGEIPPPPTRRVYQPFIYDAEELVDGVMRPRRDPFALNVVEETQQAETGPRPDPDRRREPLEEFPLDSLAMVGTIGGGESIRALIQAPDKVVHVVSTGNYLGRDHGRITRISETEIELVELISDGAGGWRERKVAVPLREQ
ncbi:MAG: pilus assembly protein PilP [Xanthomonadales bacterium]|nr:pilus assembly protein PilP [Xanthomonadales bacterium]